MNHYLPTVPCVLVGTKSGTDFIFKLIIVLSNCIIQGKTQFCKSVLYCKFLYTSMSKLNCYIIHKWWLQPLCVCRACVHAWKIEWMKTFSKGQNLKWLKRVCVRACENTLKSTVSYPNICLFYTLLYQSTYKCEIPIKRSQSQRIWF